MNVNLNPFHLKCLSLNVRGLNNTIKRKKIFSWLRQQNAQIIFLQETYSSEAEESIWANDWGGPIFFNHGTKHSRGVMILLQNAAGDVVVKNLSKDDDGRLIILETEIEENTFIFVNIYSPNILSKQKTFFERINYSLEDFFGENIVVGGDFNCALTSMDKEGGAPVEQKQPTITTIKRLMDNARLIDIWREKNSSKKQYTWRDQQMQIECRLDYFLSSQHLKCYTEECYITYAPSCDHCAVVLVIQTDQFKNRRGPGFWKFNNSLLNDDLTCFDSF